MKRLRLLPLRQRGGFTLLEMVLTIIILGLIVGVGTPVLVSGYQSFLLGTSIQRADAVARLAMERISRELRNGLQATVTPLALNSASVQFTNSDGDAVTLSFQDNTLVVQHNAQSGVVAENIVGSFSVSDESDVSNRFMPYRLISVQLTVTQAIDQFEGQSVTLRSAIVPRNP
ncbi:MAG: prepilin-type N-terminal cleavage/methylation domain-containing protein [Magnetococcales bacterium]|nr:prepilin-type N-terminal cleavage/methylation domain-containing protein [Magnetococcales bacterium]MBF0113841.1 prepilin-type N-terminal cleavage/methylation domain-containing protein [Magnetococcales bacterium]